MHGLRRTKAGNNTLSRTAGEVPSEARRVSVLGPHKPHLPSFAMGPSLSRIAGEGLMMPVGFFRIRVGWTANFAAASLPRIATLTVGATRGSSAMIVLREIAGGRRF